MRVGIQAANGNSRRRDPGPFEKGGRVVVVSNGEEYYGYRLVPGKETRVSGSCLSHDRLTMIERHTVKDDLHSARFQ